VTEPERLVQISLGQENPRMRMNAAPGSRTIRTRTLKGFHNTVLLTLPDSMCCLCFRTRTANGRECNTQNSRSFASIRGSKTQHIESGRVSSFV